jgi:hypothetical protein
VRPNLLFLLLLLLFIPRICLTETQFSQENAYALLKTLIHDIGPRTMGSPAERRAMEWAVQKFKEYGCDRSYLMRFTVADEVNTSSGIAVGVLNGTTGRTIVIGAHIDTSAPEVPGANDDGSGVACVLELARVLAQRQSASTIVLCCWGGEERGLFGSEYFVSHYPLIDSVDLMLQIDMADGAGYLELDPGHGRDLAPRWLVQAAYRVFYDELGYSDLLYPMHSELLMLAAGGGSDHESFLHKGIPALAFISDINYPIHTPADNIENFTPTGLRRSGDLVLTLVERFDREVHGRTTERYILAQVGNTPIFLPPWILWSLVGVAFAVSLVAFTGLRSRRTIGETAVKVKWSGGKLLLFTILIQACIWYSESLVGFLRGERFPWVNNFPWYVLLGLLCGLLGVWISLQLARRLRLTQDQYPFARVAFALFLLFTVFASLAGARIAVYPAVSLLLFSLAILVRPPALKLVLVLVAPYPIVRLLFSESLGLVQRGLSRTIPGTFFESVLYDLLFVALFTLVSLPFVFAFAAVYRDAHKDLLSLRKFSRTPAVIGLGILIVGLIAFLMQRQTYDQRWRSVVRVEQRYALGTDSSVITLRGSEFLKGLRSNKRGEEGSYGSWSTYQRLSTTGDSRVTWCELERQTHPMAPASDNDTLRQVERILQLRSHVRPFTVRVLYASPLPFEASSPWAYEGGVRGSRKTFSWYSFPSSSLMIPVTLRLRHDQVISESVEITYDTLAYPLQLSRPWTDVVDRTVVTARDTVRVSPRAGIHPGG